MKNLILTMCLLLIVSLTYAQLHVVKEQLDNNGDILTQNGAVGIGTDLPTEMLDVNGNVNIKSYIRISPPDHIGGFNGESAEFFSGKQSGKYVTSFAHRGDGHFSLRAWNPQAAIHFTTSSGTATTGARRLSILPGNGFIGINTATPTAKLEVNGAAKKTNGGEWAGTSDKRAKKNINQYTKGIEDVMKINPVTYNYNGKAGIADTETTYVGLIAQEFAEIEPNAVKPFSHTEEGSNKTEEFLSMDASSVKYMLVNAVKEQQALIEAQQAKIESLEEKMDKLATNGASIATPGASEMSVLLEGSGAESALLAQNSPNPFRTNTRIEYFIPQNSKHCRLSFRDMNGKELKQVDIEHEGIGAIDLTSKDLAAGIYSYVLYVNGDIVASKKMILRQ